MMDVDAPAPPAADPARLAACPDCGGQVSTLAPACIHCGRPLARVRRPMAGIVTAVVLGVLSIVLAVLFPVEQYTYRALGNVQLLLKGAHVLGSAALIAGALMSLGGNRRGNRVVRAVSWGMIAVLLPAMGAVWAILAGRGMADGATSEPRYASFILTVTLTLAGPWLLYLFLFRKSRHP